MDLLDLLLRDPHEGARQELRAAINPSVQNPVVEEFRFNTYEVILDREVGEAWVFDVLDGTAEPTIITLDELRRRLV
ncbi:hypothetical protein [Pimelobacter simplex]|uniref:hypothetical protein n=1 Tax=Nocardioides simplex TaxID=2045 RepID=UPI00193361C2|nr:hypothetical protein [Pimelobacter simplex]